MATADGEDTNTSTNDHDHRADEATVNVAPVTNDGSVTGNEDAVISIPTLSGSDSDGSVPVL